MANDQEALIPMAHPSIRLEVFEGPLDLLLFLIRRNEIDIYDIPIESLTKQYLETLYQLKQLDLDLAGDFFVMAATLMYIKSRMLLPAQESAAVEESEEEPSDPRWELVQQLIAYKKIKERAKDLDQLIQSKQDFLPRRVEEEQIPASLRPIKDIDHMDLWQAFINVLHRLSEKIHIGQIHDEQVTVAEQMAYLLNRLNVQKEIYFSELIQEGFSFMRMVSTFLALLELTRMKKLCLEQDCNFADILCKKMDPDSNEA